MTNAIYVESYGDDNNNGTENAPVATLTKAMSLVTTERNTICVGKGEFIIPKLVALSKNGVTVEIIGQKLNTTILVQMGAPTNNGDKFLGKINFYKLIIKPVDKYSGDTRCLCYTTDTYTVNYYNCVFAGSNNGRYPTSTFFYTDHRDAPNRNKNAHNCLFLKNISICDAGLFSCYNCASTNTTNIFNYSCVKATDCKNGVKIDSNYLITNYDNTLYGVYSGEEYSWENIKYFIKQQDKYYTIKEEKYVGNFYEELTLDEINNNYDDLGFTLLEFITDVTINGETFKPIDKFEEFSIVTNESIKSVIIEGIKSNTEMIATNNDFPTTIHSNIDFIENQATIAGNGAIKITFSIDEGVTWKTHNGTEFIDLPITIPCKPYEELIEDELIQWNNARDEILTNGINSATLKTLDFNMLTFDKIRFAYVLHVEDVKDTALNKKLTWQFDAKGSMKLMKDSEIDIEVLPTGIKVTPKVDSSLIKLNIVTDDGQNSSSGGDEGGNTANPTLNFATRQDILGLF